MTRYAVGLDLGTTNCALAYAELAADEDRQAPIQILDVPQLVAAGEIAERPLLPSFLYLPASDEFAPSALELPWKAPRDRFVGAWARDHGARAPGRLVSSAKSWLSHPGVDRRAGILPHAAAEGTPKISPVTAQASYLEHLRDAWNSRIAGKNSKERLEYQEVHLTVPASFDAVARELTTQAAAEAGLKNVILLEEPQAAFYAWLAAQGDAWRKQVKVGDLILVCDVGGGTTDFTLIQVADSHGDLSLERVAVGEHILLGGDNMDLALAYATAANLPQGMEGLDPIQRVALVHACRNAKELLFAEPRKSAAPVAILGRGSRVIGGSLKTELSRETLNRVLIDGFLPDCQPTDRPAHTRRSGLLELGLPFAADPAITRHLARFLGDQAAAVASPQHGLATPTAVLFNGGVFKAAELRSRIVSVLSQWAGRPVPMLDCPDLDLAVARGAAYYAQVRKGKGVRIRGGVARSYYVGIETSAPAVPGVPPPIKALCVVPMGMEEGAETVVPAGEIGLVVGEPASFRFLGSTTRRDQPGTLLERWNPDELHELAPLETALEPHNSQPGEPVPITLHSRVTELGALELWCQSTRDDRRWKLEFNVRENPRP